LKSLTDAIDAGTPGGKLVFHIFGVIRSAKVGEPVMTGSSFDAPQILPSCSHQPVYQAIDLYPPRVFHTGKEGSA
jgi:hypothetical protein